MRLKGVVMEDFINYMKPSLFLITSICDWKCCYESNLPVTTCQNESIIRQETKDFSNESIYQAYINNDISKSICIGGLEPMLQFNELYDLIKYFRDQGCNDEFVIYTGYNENEIDDKVNTLKQFNNIIIKFGRFKPNDESHYDEVLGIRLISSNQYGKRIS